MKRCPTCRRIYENQAAVCHVDGTALSETGASADPLVGQLVTPKYRLVRRIGGTGLGVVYQAEEVATGNQVAVKLLLSEIRRDVELVKHFWWEARLAAASNPPRIVRVYEIDRLEDGRVFIAMEYVEGESLAELLRREGPLEPGRAVRLAMQIAQGLAAASQAGVTHRNLKPQNVMVVGPDRIKLTDFGVGRLRETALGGRPTGPSLIAPEYLAPEQLKGDEVNFRADIYALGALLYTMLTGAAPARQPQESTPLRKVRPEVPDAIEQFVMRAMDRRPERRQGGMEEVVEGLRALASIATVADSVAVEIPAPAPELAPLEQVSEEPSPRQAEPPMASLLTLLRDGPPPSPHVADDRSGATARESRLRAMFAQRWLAIMTQVRSGLGTASPAVAQSWSRLVAWLLLLPGLLGRLGVRVGHSTVAASREVRTRLAKGVPYLSAGWSRLGVWALAVGALVGRWFGALWQASLGGWQRARGAITSRRPTADLSPLRLSSSAPTGTGRLDGPRETWWQARLAGGKQALANFAPRRVQFYLWWSHRGRLVVTAFAGVVVVGATTWAVLDWAAGGKPKRPSPDEGTTAMVVEPQLTAELREAENERRREEARAARPVVPAARVEPVTQAEASRAQVELEAGRRAELEASRQAEEARRRLAQLEATRRAEEERTRQAQLEATQRAEDERRRQTELEASRRVDEERRRQAEMEASRRAEEERRYQAELEASRRAEEERRRQAEVETARRAEDERRRQAEMEATRRAEVEATRRADEERRRAEAETARVRAEAARQIARPVEPASARPALSAADVTRIRTLAEQKLQSRGLFRVSTADRWGVALEVGSTGEVTLSGTLRDMDLYNDAVRLVREVPGVQTVRATNVRVADTTAATAVPGETARIRTEIQQRLRSRGLLRESSADRWGVTVEVGSGGDVTLVGMVRDAGLQAEAVRLAQGVQGVQQVKQEIRLP
jgi:serine/threonine protein kinase/osmotically-inducible protein OsmY